MEPNTILIKGLKIEEYAGPQDFLREAELRPFYPDVPTDPEKMYTERKLPVTGIFSPDAFRDGRPDRLYIAFSGEVERLLQIPINTIVWENQRLAQDYENVNNVLRMIRHRIDGFNELSWWRRVWHVLKGGFV